MQHCLHWSGETQLELQSKQPTDINRESDIPNQKRFLQEYENASRKTIEDGAQVISEKVTGYMDKVLAGTEERLTYSRKNWTRASAKENTVRRVTTQATAAIVLS